MTARRANQAKFANGAVTGALFRKQCKIDGLALRDVALDRARLEEPSL